MAGQGEIVAGIYNLSYQAIPARDTLRILAATPGKTYKLKSVPQKLRIGRFGGLIKHVAPVRLKADGMVVRLADRHFAMDDGQENYICYGETLRSGVNLAMQYSGTGYSPELRILGDFGSSLYVAEEE
jgi:alpha-galactosidase